MTLEFDGSLAGFFTAAACVFGLDPIGRCAGVPASELRLARRGAADAGLFDDGAFVPTERPLALRFYAKLRARLQGEALRAVSEAFLSETPGIEADLLDYCRIALREGMRIRSLLSEPSVAAVEKAARRTRMEVHRFHGFVRFSELADGSLYSAIEPACDILPLLGAHFASRFPNERWVIRDVLRDAALVHDARRKPALVSGLRLDGEEAPGSVARASRSPGAEREVCGEAPDAILSADELAVRAAWRRYFADIAIKERTNPKLQQSRVPFKYRGHLTEFN